MIPRTIRPLAALLAMLTLFRPAYAENKLEEGFTALFNGKDLSGFKTVLWGAKRNADAFTIREGMIHVSGSPHGYLHTDKTYKNYVLRFDWKFLRDGGTGTLIHITAPHKIWPKCVEVQGGTQAYYGDMFGLGARGRFRTDAAARKRAIKFNEWNTTEIISRNRRLTCKINGIQVSTGKGELTEGHIGWQSEGAVFQLKNIRIKIDD